jgi:hypothetical protein
MTAPPGGPQRFSLGRWSRMKRAAARELEPREDARAHRGAAIPAGVSGAADAASHTAVPDVSERGSLNDGHAVHVANRFSGSPAAASAGTAVDDVALPLVPSSAAVGERRDEDVHALHAEAAPLPSIDSLNLQSDFTGFMKRDVDPSLQRAALRKLFADPHFNVMDGLDTYIDDYTKPDPIPESVFAQLLHARAIFGAAADDQGAAVASEDHGADVPVEPAVQDVCEDRRDMTIDSASGTLVANNDPVVGAGACDGERAEPKADKPAVRAGEYSDRSQAQPSRQPVLVSSLPSQASQALNSPAQPARASQASQALNSPTDAPQLPTSSTPQDSERNPQ